MRGDHFLTSVVFTRILLAIWSTPVTGGQEMNALGVWTAWSPCSSTCEPQLSERTRECLQSVIKCHGDKKQYRVCHKKNCKGPAVNLRKNECDLQNHVPFRGRRYHWRSFIDSRSPCAVTCESSRYGFQYKFDRFNLNGVSCAAVDGGLLSPERVCLHGRCVMVGCDGVVGSGLQTDHCGVCGGDNNGCRIVRGIYARSQLNHGYNHVTSIPRGACHINITELDRSRNYLVLKYPNGTDVINGERSRLRRPGQYWAAGTIFTYRKQKTDNCPGECLYAPGPTATDLDIQLLTFSRNPGIDYMFTIPTDQLSSVIDSYSPLLEDHYGNQAQHHPGNMADTASHANTHISFKHQPRYMLDSYTAKGFQALEGSSSTNNNKQQYGTQDAIDRYRQAYIDSSSTSDDRVNDGNTIIAYDRYAVPRDSIKNRDRDLNVIPQSGNLHAGSRQDNILGGSSNGYQSYDGSLGEVEKPGLTVPDTIDEVNFHWVISGFTPCSVTCGGGRQDTNVVCMKKKTNVVVTDDNCDSAKKNVQTIICNKKPCPPSWESEAWSLCSVTCGLGSQTRQVDCQQRFSANIFIPVTHDLCASSEKPDTTRSCEVKPCAQWVQSNWSKCSVVCGQGQETREVKCVNTKGVTVQDWQCHMLKPDTSRACDMGTCAQGWFLTRWMNQCKRVCGKAYYTRSAYCLAEDGSPLSEVKCGKKPRTRKACRSTRPCGGFWFEGPWTPCSTSCGASVQTRDIVCIKKLDRKFFTVVGAENCKEHKKPPTKRVCSDKPKCPSKWFMTRWSKCSVNCGTGFKTRDMKCLNPDSSPSSQCSADSKPTFRRTCNTLDCNQPQLDQDPSCLDNNAHCKMVVQSRLCNYDFFEKDCCHSCKLYNLQYKYQVDSGVDMHLAVTPGLKNDASPGS